MLKRSLVIAYSTPNYSVLTDQFLGSLQNIGDPITIAHKIDETISHPFIDQGFQTDLWYYCVYHKIKHFVDVMTSPDIPLLDIDYFIFSDCDIYFYKKNAHEWKNLETYIKSQEEKDIFFMRENHMEDEANTGFFIIKNNKNLQQVIRFFEQVLTEMEQIEQKDMPFGDQSVINKNKHELNYDFIPNEYVAWGTIIFDKHKTLFHHSVATNDKLAQIQWVRSQIE